MLIDHYLIPRTLTLAFALLALLMQPLMAQENANKRKCLTFEELRMTLEQNATDGDTEVVLIAQGQDEGLHEFIITAPNGKELVDFDGRRRGSVGMREFLFESAEPPELDRVLASFPEGKYRFFGETISGECLTGSAVLSHELAPATVLLTPLNGQTVPITNVVLSWQPVAGAVKYVVGLNNEDAETEMLIEVLPPTTSIAIPATLLQPGSEYQFEVGVSMESGNITFVELNFFTAE